jgi:putative restriction endonuclease
MPTGMRGVIVVTDHDWFEFLAGQPRLDEVNFWRPSDTRTPRQLQPGMPVIFKLRKHHGGWIVGFGIFAKHKVLPAWLAWESFEQENGAATFAEMRERIERLRHGRPPDSQGDYPIGCIMLSQPLFLPRERWVAPPADWKDNVVQGAVYDLGSGEGARIWNELQLWTAEPGADIHAPEPPRYGEPTLYRPRLGQGIFRISVIDAYSGACAVTGEHSLPALEAAHIRPFADQGPHEVSNGLLFRSDIHRLFDKGYVSVTPDYHFVVSRRLKDEWENGRTYYPLHGRVIALPRLEAEKPRAAMLEWHLSRKFKGA